MATTHHVTTWDDLTTACGLSVDAVDSTAIEGTYVTCDDCGPR